MNCFHRNCSEMLELEMWLLFLLKIHGLAIFEIVREISFAVGCPGDEAVELERCRPKHSGHVLVPESVIALVQEGPDRVVSGDVCMPSVVTHDHVCVSSEPRKVHKRGEIPRLLEIRSSMPASEHSQKAH